MVKAKEATRIEEYMALPYRMEIYWDRDYWAAEFPELPGLIAGHETWEGLLAAIDDAKRTWFEGSLAHGYPIPEPQMAQDFSGKFVLRLPRALHAAAAQ